MGPETRIDCAGEGQQQFSDRPTNLRKPKRNQEEEVTKEDEASEGIRRANCSYLLTKMKWYPISVFSVISTS
jgi:hypothetical protein